MFDIIQTYGPGLGNILNLAGIGLLLLAGFFFIQYKQTDKKNIEEEARQKFTAISLIFVFYTVVAYIYWGSANSWVVQLGESLDIYFEEMAQNIVLTEGVGSTYPNQTNLSRSLNWVRTLGLIGYVLLFGATAIIGKAPVKLYEALFGN